MVEGYINKDENNGKGRPNDREGDSFGPNGNARIVNKNNEDVLESCLYPLKGDETAATPGTAIVTVAQEGIKYADLANPHKTITMYVWFGANPAAGSQIPLVPGASWSGPVDNKSDMRYKSSAAGGVLDYVLRG